MNGNGEGRLASLEEALREGFARVENKVDGLHGEIAGVHTDLGGLRGEIDGLRGEIDGLRGQLDGVRQELTAHLAGTTDSFQVITEALEALHRAQV